MRTGLGFEGALLIMAGGFLLVLIIVFSNLKNSFGKGINNPAFRKILSKSININLISGTRVFLFGGRDVWFVVALPLSLKDVLSWTYIEIRSFLAIWIIGYGIVQVVTPRVIKKSPDGDSSEVVATGNWSYGLAATPLLLASVEHILVIPISITTDFSVITIAIILGLVLFGILFAINSSLHSYLIFVLSDPVNAASNVGFYYAANASGRLMGTLVSGFLYQFGGPQICMIASGIMIGITALVVRKIKVI